MPRWRTLGLWLVMVVFLIVVAAWGSMWAYVGYEAHHARVMLTEASGVRLGDTETSILPLVQRYRGFKWTPEPLSPKENWFDKDEYDYQQKRLGDYRYELEVSPFGTTTLRPSRLTQAMRAVRAVIPARLRPVLGMRNWGTGVDFSIRGGRVQSVSATTIFAGRSGALGHSWQLAEGMPRHEVRPRACIISASFLTTEDGGGMMIENFFTPNASEEEVGAARQFNAACLTSITGCNNFCDVAPRALDYLKRHPEAIWSIIPPKCP
jgi:hypothetical protein